MTSLHADERYADVSWWRDIEADPDPRLVSLLNPDSFEADQYRTLRYGVERSIPTDGCRVLAVTSPISGDGKTLTSINLAGAIAKSRQLNVLLLDADLRRPSIAKMLGRKDHSGPGLVDTLRKPGESLETAIWRLEPFNLSVITTRPAVSDSYDVIASGRLGELIRDARQHYDYLLLDSPPVLPAPDCRLLAEWIDGFLIVVAADRTPRKLLEETFINLGPGKILGLVFNGEAYRHTRYGKYYYAYHSHH